ncbi:MAG TPA: peptide ABC transporter substrate-binding protein [Thermomicrobiales bacterium]|nr:peptide ABC transporter substrate-binding protein [Thermomicrobiales bacterium]
MDSIELLRDEINRSQLSRRSVLKRAMALGFSAPVIAGLLAACGGDDDDGDDDAPTEAAAAPTSPPAAQPTATEAAGGEPTATEAASEESPTAAAAEPTATTAMVTEEAGGHGLVRLLWWQAPTILNNHLAQGGKDYDASHICLEPLADYDNDANLVPFLATEIPSIENGDVAEDGMSVTWRLREGVTWHDGEPFTSADVAFTYEFATHPDAATTTVANYATIESIETPDDYTIVINFSEPTPNWFTPFTGIYGYIIPEHILRDYLGAEAVNAPFNLAPTGTGPFKVREFRPGDVILFDRYEGYWDPGKPHFDEVELKGGGDAASAARAALVSGEVDWAWNLQVEATVLAEMESSGDGVLVSTPGPGLERLMINFTDPDVEVDGERSHISMPHPFLSDLAARQALTHVPDRDTIAGELYGVAGQPTSNVIAAPTRFVSPNTSYEFNLDKAAEMLDAAGWTLDSGQRAKDGYSVDFLYQTSTNTVRQKTQEIIKQALESIGIPTEIKAIDAAVYFSSDAGNPDTYAHFYADIEMFTNSGDPYPLNYMGFYSSTDPDNIAQQSNGWAGRNVYRWVNQEFNALFEQARTEIDPDAQVELFVGMNDLIVNDVCEIPLVHRSNVAAHAADLEGIIPSGWASDTWSLKHWRRT